MIDLISKKTKLIYSILTSKTNEVMIVSIPQKQQEEILKSKQTELTLFSLGLDQRIVEKFSDAIAKIHVLE